MKLEITTSPLKILETRPSKNIFIKIIKTILISLEKYFGSEILIKTPSDLYGVNDNINDEILKIINIASRLQSLGIIENITKKTKYADEPFAHIYHVSCPGKAYGAGITFFEAKKAIWKALGEAVERHLWYNSNDFYKKRLLKTSYKNIKNKKLNIFSLAGFSQEQKNKLSSLQFGENTILNWVPAFSLTLKKTIYCPIQLISAFYFNKERAQEKEPMLRWCITTGLATGRFLEEAIIKGILEIIERDAFMISYLNKLSPPIIDLEYLSAQDEDIANIIKNFKRYNLEIYTLQLPTDFSGVYIVAVFIIDRTDLGPALSVGASADFNLKTAFLNALSESLIVRYGLKNKFQNEINLQKIGREERLIYWAKPENLPKIDFFFKGEKIKVNLEQNFYKTTDDKKYYKEKLNFLVNELKAKNYEACYVELTTPEIKKLNLRSVFVVIPELQPLHLDESIPYLGGKRLKEVPLKLGYQPAEILNQEPHPFP